MKRAVKTPLILLLLLIAAYLSSAQTDRSARADAKGPYYGMAGSELSFDASGSKGDITEYLWDYGDGTTGSGVSVKHSYAKEGSYPLKLKVSDANNTEDEYVTGVFIRPASILIEASAEPRRSIYDYGDVITGVGAKLTYADGRPVEDASVTGRLTAKTTVDLTFRKTASGTFHSEIKYPIVKDEDGREETEYINITIYAEDNEGRKGQTTKMLTRIPKSDLALTLQPLTGVFAAGEEINLSALLRRLRDGRTVEGGSGNVILYEEQNGASRRFSASGKYYVLNYQIPADAGPSLDYVIHARGELDETVYNVTEVRRYVVTKELALRVLAPENGTYAPSVKKIMLKVTYPDGRDLPDESLTAYVNGQYVILKRNDSLYEADYFAGNRTKINIWVFDSYGNGAGANVHLSTRMPEPPKESEGSQTVQELLGLMLPALILLAAVYAVYRIVSAGKKKRARLEKEYEETRQKIASLRAVRQNILNEYYTHKLKEEDARKRVLETEKEIAAEKLRLKELEEKLGKKHPDSDGMASTEEIREETEKKR